MLKFILPFFMLSAFFLRAQTSFFVERTNFKAEVDRNEIPLKEKFFTLDIANLNTFLSDVGDRANPAGKILAIPDTEGNNVLYEIFESSVMEPSFQAKHPSIRSYAGQGITNPQEIIRFSVTPQGFHAIILGTKNGPQYIKPYDSSKNIYSVFLRKDLLLDLSSFECGFDETTSQIAQAETSLENLSVNTNDGLLRNFRIAISSTAEFSAFYNNNLEDVLAAMSIAVTITNAVLERDLSVTLTMVDNTSIIFFNPLTDPFDNFDRLALLDQNQLTIDNNIGTSNYDIGHVFNTTNGGVASYRSSCVDDFKARAVSGTQYPGSEFFYFTFLHELGHQFGSLHTFNADNFCLDNRTSATALEPGSGTTIMSYAGVCAEQNVIPLGDLYYHVVSLQTISTHITSTTSCPVNQTNTFNMRPVADAGNNFLIPQGTPYKLTGSSTDLDGTETHTYTWEQYDLGPAGIPTDTTSLGPLVRSFEGTINPTRYIPNLQDLLDFQGSSTWEKLVTVDRNINYRLTVRDNDIRGGQTDSDAIFTAVTTSAGPFEVTSQNVANQIIWTPGTTETITWDVAGTNGNGINESSVNILLSTDQGLNYDTVLASNVPNDGTHDIIVPSFQSPKCRIMIEASNNIFFNINAAFFAIGDYSYTTDIICEDFTVDFNALIPEGLNYIQFPFTISEGINIGDLNIELDVAGSEDNGFLYYAIEFDTSGFIRFASALCPGTTNINTTFDDEGSPINCLNLSPGDNVIPLEPLSALDGLNSEGNWRFYCADINENGIRSTLNSITLNICSDGTGVLIDNTLSVDDKTLQDFSLYPNPSYGNFSLQFNTEFSDEISVEVFDITGKLIYNKNYKSNFTFDKEIELNQTKPGLYIVSVTQGNQKLNKKLIIK